MENADWQDNYFNTVRKLFHLTFHLLQSKAVSASNWTNWTIRQTSRNICSFSFCMSHLLLTWCEDMLIFGWGISSCGFFNLYSSTLGSTLWCIIWIDSSKNFSSKHSDCDYSNWQKWTAPRPSFNLLQEMLNVRSMRDSKPFKRRLQSR